MLALFCASISFGQNLEQHEWKHRVLVIASSEMENIEKQVKVLSKDKDGLEERKLVVYKTLPKKFSQGIDNSSWTKNESFFNDIKRKKNSFEVILIGLDGGVKLRQTQLLTLEKLFILIDGMPMRRAEMRN